MKYLLILAAVVAGICFFTSCMSSGIGYEAARKTERIIPGLFDYIY